MKTQNGEEIIGKLETSIMRIKGKPELGAFYFAHQVNEKLRGKIIVDEEELRELGNYEEWEKPDYSPGRCDYIVLDGQVYINRKEILGEKEALKG